MSKIWNGKIRKFKSDLVGQDGWKRMQQLLYVLNSTVNYVILRNYEGILDNLADYKHEDIDILTDEYLRIPYITNGGKASFNEKFPNTVKILNNEIKFDFDSLPINGTSLLAYTTVKSGGLIRSTASIAKSS